MVLSPDAKLIAVICADQNSPVRLWDAPTGKVHPWLAKHHRYVNALAFSPDSKVLAAAEQSGVLRLWDVATANELRRLTAPQKGRARPFPFCALAFSPDGKQLLAGSQDGVLCLWKVASGQLLYRVQTTKLLQSVAFSPDGSTFALVNGDGLSLWKSATGERVRQFEGHRGYVLAAAFAPDGRTLVSGGDDRTVRLWDVASGRERSRFDGHSNLVEAVAFSPDGKTVASGGRDQRVRLWDVGTGRELHPVRGHQGVLWALAFSPDGKMLASGGLDHVVCLWDLSTRKLLRRLEGHTGQIMALAFSLDGKTLASTAAAPDRSARLWEVASGKVLRQFQSEDRTGFGILGLSGDGKKLAAGGTDGKLHLWSLTTGKELRISRRREHGHYQTFASEEGDTLTATTFRQVVSAWVVDSGAESLPVSCKIYSLFSRAVSADGHNLAEYDRDHISIWELATGKERLRIPHNEWTWALTFSPDGRRLLGAVDRAIAVWDLATGQEIGRVRGLPCLARVLVFSPDGKTLASGGGDGTILLWDLERLPKPKRAAPQEFSAKELEAEWQALGGEDAARAYRGLGILRAAPRQVLAWLRRDLRPAAAANPKRVDQLLKDLASNDAAVREKATAELERLGERAEAALNKALVAGPPADMQLRLRRLLNRSGRLTAERLRALRMLELLEHVGTAEARQFLKQLADNKSDPWLTAEARAASGRLHQRSGR